MAQTFSPALDALSLQRGVEGKGLQLSRRSSKAVCGQETSARLHPLAWQHSWGEVHLGCLGGELAAPCPRAGLRGFVDSAQQRHAAQQRRRRAAQPPWGAAPLPARAPGLPRSGSPQFPQTSPSHPPAPQPAPLPKRRQRFLHVAFQSL